MTVAGKPFVLFYLQAPFLTSSSVVSKTSLLLVIIGTNNIKFFLQKSD